MLNDFFCGIKCGSYEIEKRACAVQGNTRHKSFSSCFAVRDAILKEESYTLQGDVSGN